MADADLTLYCLLFSLSYHKPSKSGLKFYLRTFETFPLKCPALIGPKVFAPSFLAFNVRNFAANLQDLDLTVEPIKNL